MSGQTRAAQHQAVEQRTQQRLAARQEAAQRGVETRRRNQEARIERQRAEAQEQPQVAPQASEPEPQAGQVASEQTRRTQRNVAQKGRASGSMVTVALRGESAQRLRALAVAQQMTLSKLLVRMMDSLEAQTG